MLPAGSHGVQHSLNYAEFLIVLKGINNQSQHALVLGELENCTYKLVLLLQLRLGPVNEPSVLYLHFTFALYLSVGGEGMGGLCVCVCGVSTAMCIEFLMDVLPSKSHTMPAGCLGSA